MTTKHAPWPWQRTGTYVATRTLPEEKGCCRPYVLLSSHPDEADGNAQLVMIAPTAPHDCEIPGCPGAANKRRLDAASEMLEALREMLDGLKCKVDGYDAAGRRNCDCWACNIAREARRAIAKTEGK